MRLIDADSYQFSGDLVNEPTVDAVPIVRCEDCRHSELLRDSELKKESPWCYYMEHCRFCRNMDLVEDEPLLVEDDFYCAYGERRDGGSK